MPILEGHAPLTVHFSYEVFYADCDVTASWDFDGDGLHDSSAPYVTYTYDTAGTYTVTLVITDCHGNTAKDEVVITVYPETPTKNTATKMIQWTQLNLVNGEVYKPGDDLPVLINFKNQGNLDLEGVKVSVFVPELALYRTVGPFTLYDGEEITKVIVLDLPNGAEKGTYDLRVNIDTTGDEKMHRIMYRSFEIQ